MGPAAQGLHGTQPDGLASAVGFERQGAQDVAHLVHSRAAGEGHGAEVVAVQAVGKLA